MFICKDCYNVFTEGEARITSWNSEFHCYDEEYRCPYCRSAELTEPVQCPICGEYYDGDDGVGVCEVCLEERETVGNALKYGATSPEKIEINGFITSMLDEEQINAILTKYVEEHVTDHSPKVVFYCEEEKSAFADWVAEQERK